MKNQSFARTIIEHRSRASSVRLVACAALFAACFSTPARAAAEELAPSGDEPAASSAAPAEGDVEIARSHFLRGVQFYNAGDYKLSLEEFRRSYELSQNYRILYNIGQVQQQLNNYAKALAALDRYLADGGDNVSDDRRREVNAYVTELRKKVAHVVVLANVSGAEVLIDGFPADSPSEPRQVTLDPGDHRIELRKAGYQPTSTAVTLAAGDTTEVHVNMLRVPTAIARTHERLGPAKHDRAVPWFGWASAGALALGAGVTGSLAVGQANELAKLRESPNSTGDQRDAVSKRERTLAIATDALAGAALVTAGVSLYFTLQSNKEPERAPTLRVGVGPTRLTLAGSF